MDNVLGADLQPNVMVYLDDMVIVSRCFDSHVRKVLLIDPLIVLYGEDLLTITENKRSLYHISNGLRKCAKFLLEMRKLYTYMLSLIPEGCDDGIESVKKMHSIMEQLFKKVEATLFKLKRFKSSVKRQ